MTKAMDWLERRRAICAEQEHEVIWASPKTSERLGLPPGFYPCYHCGELVRLSYQM